MKTLRQSLSNTLRQGVSNTLRQKEAAPVIIPGCSLFGYGYESLRRDYPPKLSNIRLLIGTPRSSSIFSTAFDMGPGPHM